MNEMTLAQHTYGSASQATRSPRDIEYMALARLSHGLRDAAAARDTNFPAFASAVSRNLAFWSIVATDVSGSANALPEELRERLFWLSEFVRVESRRVLRGEADVESLVEINLNMMQGLRPAVTPAPAPA